MDGRDVKTSKFLSLVLRHQPGTIGIKLDEAGWVPVKELIEASRAHGFALTREELQTVVENNDKQRFSFSPDGLLIRANQGHSIEIELGLAPSTPPTMLYHGTAERFLPSIKTRGLLKGQRHHVHLSAEAETAIKVGQRHGRPVVLLVQSGRMQQDGIDFYLSTNGVWLTEHVPVSYLVF